MALTALSPMGMALGILELKLICACLNAPGWYSSRKSATQTRRLPSTGWTEKSRSEEWCHSLHSTEVGF